MPKPHYVEVDTVFVPKGLRRSVEEGGEMGEQTYLNMKVLVIIVSQRYMLYWTD